MTNSVLYPKMFPFLHPRTYIIHVWKCLLKCVLKFLCVMVRIPQVLEMIKGSIVHVKLLTRISFVSYIACFHLILLFINVIKSTKTSDDEIFVSFSINVDNWDLIRKTNVYTCVCVCLCVSNRLIKICFIFSKQIYQ